MLAEEAIVTIRKAIQDIYARVGKHSPRWIDNDQSEGWQERRIGTGLSGHLTVSNAGAHPETPGVVKIVLVTEQGEEKATRYLPPATFDDEVFWWVEEPGEAECSVQGHPRLSWAGSYFRRKYRSSLIRIDPASKKRLQTERNHLKR